MVVIICLGFSILIHLHAKQKFVTSFMFHPFISRPFTCGYPLMGSVTDSLNPIGKLEGIIKMLLPLFTYTSIEYT